MFDISFINPILETDYSFEDKELSLKDSKSLGYTIIELTPQEKNLLISKAQEGLGLIENISNKILQDNDLKNIFIIFNTESSVNNIFDNIKNILLKNYENQTYKVALTEGGVSGHSNILLNNGETKNKSVYRKSISFSKFIENLEKINNNLLNEFNKFKNFSIKDSIASLGYSSIEELGEYYNKFIKICNIQDYSDFFKNGGSSLILNKSNFNLNYILRDIFKVLFDIKLEQKYSNVTTQIIFNDTAKMFLSLNKNIINNFDDFVESFKVNITSNMNSDKINIKKTLYVNQDPEQIDKYLSNYYHQDAMKQLVHGTNDSFRKNENLTGIASAYFQHHFAESYETGLYKSYSRYLEDEIISPTSYVIIERLKKRNEAYGDFLHTNLNIEEIKNFLRNFISNIYGQFNALHNLMGSVAKKKNYNIVPKLFIKKISEEINNQIRVNKEINIDSILKNIDLECADEKILENFSELVVLTSNGSIIKFTQSDVDDLKVKLLEKYDAHVLSMTSLNFSFSNLLKRIMNTEDEKIKDIREKLDGKIDLKTILDQKDMRSLFFISSSMSSDKPIHSYADSLNRIDYNINEILVYFLKNKNFNIPNLYFLKNIDQTSIENFFNNLKKLLKKQLQIEESFIQGRNNSKGILDDIKFNNLNLNNITLEIDIKNIITGSLEHIRERDVNSSLVGLINSNNSFDIQFYNKKDNLINYFLLFPNEAIEFFNLKDINNIKNYLVKIFNFLNTNNNFEKLNSINEKLRSAKFTNTNGIIEHGMPFDNKENVIDRLEGQKSQIEEVLNQVENKDEESGMYDLGMFGYTSSLVDSGKTYSEILSILQNQLKEIEEQILDVEQNYYQEFYTGVEFVVQKLSKKDLGSKKERTEKIFGISQFIHNFIGDKKAVSLIIDSKYFEKSYNMTISSVINEIMLSINQNVDIEKNLKFVMERAPNLIPKDYLSENILYSLNNIENIKTSNDLDLIIENLLIDNASENTRKYKYILSIVSDFEGVSQWMDKALPKIDGVFAPNFSTDKIRFRVLGDLDPYHFRVGVDTSCCQTLGGQGWSAAVDSYINPTAGVVVLEVKKDNKWSLASQSYFHYAEISEEKTNKIKKAILLDNIEAGKFYSERVYDRNFYINAYAILGRYLSSKGFDIVGCGEKYTDILGYSEFEPSSLPSDPRHFEVLKHEVKKAYTDFNTREFLDLLKPKFSFEMPDNIASVESEMSIKSARILELTLNKNGNKKSVSMYKLSKILLQYGLKKESSDVRRLITSM